MERSEVMGTQRAPWWRTVVWGTLAAGASLVSLTFSELARRDEYGWEVMVLGLGLLVALTLPLVLLWRHRAPFAVTLAASAVALVLPVGTWTALVALGSLIGRRRGREVWWTAGAAAFANAVTVVRDTSGSSSATSLVKLLLAPAGASPGVEVDLGWWVAPLLVVLALAIAVGAGLAVRAPGGAGVRAGGPRRPARQRRAGGPAGPAA